MSDKPTLNVCLIGQKFMGRTHSNAYLKVDKFFDLPMKPVMHTICARDEAELKAFADQWGWQHTDTDWKSAIAQDDIDLVDIGTPNHVHKEPAIAALEAGKHVACEKPLAGTLEDAKAMMEAAQANPKCKTFVWYNYRRVPAVALAYQLAREGRLGRIYHVRASYLQDWGGPDQGMTWRFKKETAGSGAHGDLNAHIIDMARFITGEEIEDVKGALAPTFIKQRKKDDGTMDDNTVDDALLFIGTLTGGGICSFEASRVATGNQNRNGIEINGEKGSIKFDFEDMNHLYYYDATQPRKVQGWTQIMATHGETHPYVGNWWPDAHILGYEHGFINEAADIVNVIAGQAPVVPLPDFEDAYKTQLVLDKAAKAAGV